MITCFIVIAFFYAVKQRANISITKCNHRIYQNIKVTPLKAMVSLAIGVKNRLTDNVIIYINIYYDTLLM